MKNLLNKIPSGFAILIILFIIGTVMFLFRVTFESMSEKNILISEGKCEIVKYESLPNYQHKMVINVGGYMYNTPNENTILNMLQYKNNYCYLYKGGLINYNIKK